MAVARHEIALAANRNVVRSGRVSINASEFYLQLIRGRLRAAATEGDEAAEVAAQLRSATLAQWRLRAQERGGQNLLQRKRTREDSNFKPSDP